MTDVNQPDPNAADTELVEVPDTATLTKDEASQGGPTAESKLANPDVTGTNLDADNPDVNSEPSEPSPASYEARPAHELQDNETLITRDNPRPGAGVRTAMYADEFPASGPNAGHVLPNGMIAGSEVWVEGGVQAPDRVIPRPDDVPGPSFISHEEDQQDVPVAGFDQSEQTSPVNEERNQGETTSDQSSATDQSTTDTSRPLDTDVTVEGHLTENP